MGENAFLMVFQERWLRGSGKDTVSSWEKTPSLLENHVKCISSLQCYLERPCGNACRVSGDSLTTHMVVYSPVARMTTLIGGAISLRVDVKEPVRTQNTLTVTTLIVFRLNYPPPPPLAAVGFKQ